MRIVALGALLLASCHWLLPFEHRVLDARPDGSTSDGPRTDHDHGPSLDHRASDAAGKTDLGPCIGGMCECKETSTTACSIVCPQAQTTIKCGVSSGKVYCECATGGSSSDCDTAGDSLPLGTCVAAFWNGCECP